MHVAPGETRDEDLLVIGGTVVVDGRVNGDVVTVGGDVIVRGHVGGDALALWGEVIVDGPDAVVAGNAFAVLGAAVTRAGGQVQGRVRTVAHLPGGRTVGYLGLAWSEPVLVLRLLSVLFFTVGAMLAALAAPGALVQASDRVVRRPLQMAAIGALATSSLVLTLVLFTSLVVIFVGIPLLILLALAWTVLAVMALAAVFHGIGEVIAVRLRWAGASGYANVLVGALVVSVLSFVPLAGELVLAGAWLTGAGAVLVAARRAGRSPAAPAAGDRA